ncbi:MAG TPA: cysteine--tRNA ligase [Myxococcota bacterium]|nr:cysteine--tRNA ligase [Myxococcota bacterium]
MAELVLFNSLGRRKQVFEPIEPGHARVYTCGPTVYSRQHIGNLRSVLFADLLVRGLRLVGLRVTHVINVTDVGHLTDDADLGEDKMERAAARTGRRAQDIAREYTELWLRDRRLLNIRDPDVLCRATEHIPQQIAMVRALEEKGYTYRIEGDGLYFDTSKFPRYAELARLDLAAQREGARIGEVAGKRNPADFALWKLAPAGVRRQQEWDSPWGRGFPGWHIECSAMSTEYLGRRFDIHTGGVEHLPVHHTNELAQSECALDVHPWVRVWMHHDWILFRGEKIAKSTGNVLVLDDLVAAGYEPLAYRYFLLQAHYRQQQLYTDEAMAAAATGYRRLLGQAVEVREAEGEARDERIAPQRARFREAVCDDLNAPRALAVAWDVARSESLAPAERRALLLEFDAWLGLDLASGVPRDAAQESDPRIDALVAERERARRAKDFAAADRIRGELDTEGIAIEDTPQGPRWRRKA